MQTSRIREIGIGLGFGREGILNYCHSVHAEGLEVVAQRQGHSAGLTAEITGLREAGRCIDHRREQSSTSIAFSARRAE